MLRSISRTVPSRIITKAVRKSSTDVKMPFAANARITDITPTGNGTPPYLLVSVQTPGQKPEPWVVFGYTGHSAAAVDSINQNGFRLATYFTLNFEHAKSHAGSMGRVLTVGMPCSTYLQNLSARGHHFTLNDLTKSFDTFVRACEASLGFDADAKLQGFNDFQFYKPTGLSVLRGAKVMDTKDPTAIKNAPVDYAIVDGIRAGQSTDAKESFGVKIAQFFGVFGGGISLPAKEADVQSEATVENETFWKKSDLSGAFNPFKLPNQI